MGDQTRHFTATIPASTPVASPVTVAIAVPPMIVRSVHWRVPHGPMGNLGWRLAMGGVQVLPSPGAAGTFAGDQWIVANQEANTWYPEGAPDSGAWQVIGYNTGTNQHSVYLTFELDFPSKPVQLRPLFVPHDLSSSPDLSMAGPPVRRR